MPRRMGSYIAALSAPSRGEVVRELRTRWEPIQDARETLVAAVSASPVFGRMPPYSCLPFVDLCSLVFPRPDSGPDCLFLGRSSVQLSHLRHPAALVSLRLVWAFLMWRTGHRLPALLLASILAVYPLTYYFVQYFSR